jgi:hypothetical protein
MIGEQHAGRHIALLDANREASAQWNKKAFMEMLRNKM